MSADDEVREVARTVGDHPIVETGARLGYAGSGLLHLLIAWIGLQLAVSLAGASGQSADQSGAFQTLSSSAAGQLALWATGVGMILLGVWQLTEALVLRRTSRRVKAVSKAVMYAVLGLSALGAATGGQTESAEQTASITATLMDRPLGSLVVAVVGLTVIGVAAYHVVKGWTARFRSDLAEQPPAWVMVAGRYGYVAKGVALVFVGVLFVTAAVTQHPENSTGMDGALRTLGGLPGGRVPMFLVAAGFAAYAVYSGARARYCRL